MGHWGGLPIVEGVAVEAQVVGNVTAPVVAVVLAGPDVQLRVNLVRIVDCGVAERILRSDVDPEGRSVMRRMVDETQVSVNGEVRLKLYRGNVIVTGRRSPNSLYDERVATFEADTVYNQRDAEGFIKLNALRLRLRGAKDFRSV